MSFSFSIGDFVTVAGLIKNTIASLRASGGSASEYQALIHQFHILERTLHEIDHLQGSPQDASEISALKVVALSCLPPIEDFAHKLKRYEPLGVDTQLVRKQGRKKMKAVLQDCERKLRWGWSGMRDEAQQLRIYLMVFVLSLNTRMETQGL